MIKRVKLSVFAALLFVLIVATQQTVAFASSTTLKISGVHVLGDFVIGRQYNQVEFHKVTIYGVLSYENSDEPVTMLISDDSSINGFIVNRKSQIKNNGYIKQLVTNSPTVVTNNGKIDYVVKNASTKMEMPAEIETIGDGKPMSQTGFITILGNTYYAKEDGTLAKGFITISDKQYFFNKRGEQQIGWVDSNSKRYYIDGNGSLAKGLLTIDRDQYYFDDNGQMQKGLITINLNQYYFNDNGVMQKGLVSLNEKQYYFGDDGMASKGIVSIGNNKCYFNADGEMQKGYVTIDDKQYYFDDNGVMQKGLVSLNEKQYYFGDDGTASKGIVSIGNNKCYFNADGEMQKGYVTIDDKQYYFDDNGHMLINAKVDQYRADYDGTLNDTLTGNAKLDAAVGEIMSEIINDKMTEDEKMKIVYKWPLTNTSWRSIVVDAPNGPPDDQAYQYALYMLDNRKGSCEHYAAVMAVMYKRLGYNVKLISGTGVTLKGNTNPHTWVKVSIDGNYYSFDSQNEMRYTNTRWSCYKKTDKEFRQTHHYWVED